jgi:hypothetical protein
MPVMQVCEPQERPQVPQFAPLLLRSAQAPEQHVCPGLHVRPHCPQFVLLLLVFTHVPPHAVKVPQGWQAPFWHTELPPHSAEHVPLQPSLAPPHLLVQLGTQPQTLAVTAPQVCPDGQGAEHVPPHPSGPLHLPVQSRVQQVPFTQVLPAPVQVPQVTCFPQLSVAVPQLAVPQVSVLLAEVQPHRPAAPPPPQV